ncbi:hypothetical protein AAG906_034594 [Vitis piasezkii]
MDSVMTLGTAKPVVIFTKNSLCCMSHSIKTLISSYGASPTVYELDEMPNGEQMEKALPILGCPNLPAVFIGKKLVGGAREIMSLQVRGELSDLLIEAKAIFFWNKK